MASVYISSITWPESSIIKIQTADGCQMCLHKPFLKHRWPMYNQNPELALETAQSLNKDALQALLLFIYSNLPAKLSYVQIFQRCGLTNPASLQDSTFTDDMRNMMNDPETYDFTLHAAEDGKFVGCHRPVLAARSKYFKALFISNSLENETSEWRCAKPIPYRTLQFFVEYLYTGQITSPEIPHIIPLCWLVRYLRLSNENEIENIVISVLSRELNNDNVDVISKIADEWNVRCVKGLVVKHYSK